MAVRESPDVPVDKRTATVLKPSLWSMATVAGLTLVSFVTNIVVARALGVEGRGVYAAVLLITTVAAGLAQLGLGPAFVFQYRANVERQARSFIWTSVTLMAVTAAIVASAMVTLGGNALGEYWVEMIWLAVTYGLLLLLASMSQVEGSLIPYNLIRALLPCAILLIGVLLWLLKKIDVLTLLISQGVVSTVLGIAAMFWLLRFVKHRKGAPLKTADSIFLGLKYHATTTLGLASGNVDKLALLVAGGGRRSGFLRRRHLFGEDPWFRPRVDFQRNLLRPCGSAAGEPGPQRSAVF